MISEATEVTAMLSPQSLRLGTREAGVPSAIYYGSAKRSKALEQI